MPGGEANGGGGAPGEERDRIADERESALDEREKRFEGLVRRRTIPISPIKLSAEAALDRSFAQLGRSRDTDLRGQAEITRRVAESIRTGLDEGKTES